MIELPIKPEGQYHHIKSVAKIGDLAFAGLGRAVTQEASILVFNTRTGDYLGSLFPGSKLWGETSWLDIAWVVSAFARENSEIIVTVENNWKNLQTVPTVPGVDFGETAFHVVDRCPKTTPDPVRVADQPR